MLNHQFKPVQKLAQQSFKVRCRKLRKDTHAKIWHAQLKQLDQQNEYSAKAVYWLEQVEKWTRLSRLTSRVAPSAKWDKASEQVFDEWTQSEFSGDFLKLTQKGQKIKAASAATLKLMQQHLQSIAKRHLGLTARASKTYRTVFELGEFGKKKSYQVEFLCDGHSKKLLTWDRPNADKQIERVLAALGKIKTFSPSSYERFIAFTELITPIKQKELVSYSLQSLPGYSFINLYHRDDLDLCDDLLHENGHHHLNAYLHAYHLINESAEPTYWSPWRRSPRPIRGIYHAYFTFYWAYQWYADLARSLVRKDPLFLNIFPANAHQKILERFLEEGEMLRYSWKDLQFAYKRGQITAHGFKLIKQTNNMMKDYYKLEPRAERLLAKAGHKSLAELRQELQRARLSH